ncbi:MAG: lipocalin family protein [Sodaliphilus sp.]
MKKRLFIASGALILALAACSGDKANTQENAEQVVQQVEDSATVIGKWVDANQKGFELLDDGSAKAINNAEAQYVEWNTNEAGDTIHIISAADTATFAMQFSGTQLTLTDKDGNRCQYSRQK